MSITACQALQYSYELNRLLVTGQTVFWVKQTLSDCNKGTKCCEEATVLMVALDKGDASVGPLI